MAVLTHNLMVNQVSDTLQMNEKQSEEYVSFRTQDISTVIYSARLASLNSSEPLFIHDNLKAATMLWSICQMRE